MNQKHGAHTDRHAGRMYKAWAPVHSEWSVEMLCRSGTLHFGAAQWQTEARLCKFHYGPGTCFSGAICTFAHGLVELKQPEDVLLHRSDWPHRGSVSHAFQRAVEMEAASGRLPAQWQAYNKERSSTGASSSSFGRPKEGRSEDNLPKPGQGGDLPKVGQPHEFKPPQDDYVGPGDALTLIVLPVCKHAACPRCVF